jgi:hypothetical protein
MSDDVEIQVTLTIGLVGCQRKFTVFVDRTDWEGMTPRERDEYLFEDVMQKVEYDYEAINE